MSAKAPIPIMAFRWECWKNSNPPHLYVSVLGTGLSRTCVIDYGYDVFCMCREAHDSLQQEAARLLRVFRKWERGTV
jgi:hypothetical protein